MKTQLNLKEIEKRAFRSTYQDGLWDIYFGLIVIFMALFLHRQQSGYSFLNIVLMLGCFLVPYGLFWAGKKFITVPRLGQVVFGELRKRRNRTMYIVLGVFVFLQAAMVVVTAAGVFNSEFSAMLNRLLGKNDDMLLVVASIASLMVGSGMMVLVYFSDFQRGFYITVLMAVAVFVMVLYDQPLVPILIGTLILIPGIVLLFRFIQNHPIPGVEGSDE